jgi:hypothetical protein
MKAGSAMSARRQLPGKKSSWLFFLTMTVLSGCSVLYNSAHFYQDIPVRPINWREYTSD